MLTGGGNRAKPTKLNAGSTSELEFVKTSENKLFIPDSRRQLTCHWGQLAPPQLWALEPSRTERAPRAEPPRPHLKVPPIMFSGFFLPRVGIFWALVGFQMRQNLFLIISLAALNIKEESEDESASPKESCVEIFPCGSGVSINIKTWVFYQGWFPRFGFFYQ